MNQIRAAFKQFINETKSRCEEKAKEDFQSFTSVLDWDLMSGLFTQIDEEYDYLDCSTNDTKERVEQIMNKPPSTVSLPRSRQVNRETYNEVRDMAAKLFAGVRYFFTKYMRSKCNALFLAPMFKDLGLYLNEYFRNMTNDDYEALFNTGHVQLTKRKDHLEEQLVLAKEQCEKFKQVISNFNAMHISSQ